jgi:esterase
MDRERTESRCAGHCRFRKGDTGVIIPGTRNAREREDTSLDTLLHHDRLTAPDTRPDHWIYVLHGAYGAGRNWASVMRRVVRQRPEWGALLVDLRQHGSSQGFPPPHTVRAAAGDVAALAEGIGLPPAAILGHSFGGKVALLYAADATRASSVRQVWVIDSSPDAREPGGSAWTMLNLLRTLPDRFDTREQLIDALETHGFHRGVAQWMATNLEPADGAYRWRFDFAALESLLVSFFETDAWPIVEQPPAGLEVHMVRAEQSDVLSGNALRRIEAADSGRTFLHTVAGGHWVNAENPGAIEDLLVQKLPA